MNGKISHVYRLEDHDEYFAMMERDERCTEVEEPVRAAHLLVRKTDKPEHEGRHVIWIHLKDGTALRFYINQEGRLTGTQQFLGILDARFDLDMQKISQKSVKKHFHDAVDKIRRGSEKIEFLPNGIAFWSIDNSLYRTTVRWTGTKAIISEREYANTYYRINKKIFDNTIRTVIEEMTKEKLKGIPDQNDRNARDDCDG